MENTNDRVSITLDEYRDLLSQLANYAMLKEVIKAGVRLSYSNDDLTLDQTTIDVVLKYILSEAYTPTIEALKAKEDYRG